MRWKLFDDKENYFHEATFDHVASLNSFLGWDFIYHEIYNWEFSPTGCIYEMWDCMLEENDIVVDLGANVGFFTHKASQIASQVIAVDGSPEIFSCLVENTKDLSNVNCLNASVTGGKEMPYLWSFKGNPLQISLEEIFSLYQIEKIDFLKCDIEGGEYDLFESVDQSTLDKIDRIAVETHNQERNENFHIPGKIRHSYYWDYVGGAQTMFYFVTPK